MLALFKFLGVMTYGLQDPKVHKVIDYYQWGINQGKEVVYPWIWWTRELGLSSWASAWVGDQSLSCPALWNPMDCSRPGSSVLGISQASGLSYWSGLPFPSSGDLPSQGLNQCLLHWQADSSPPSQLGIPFWSKWPPLNFLLVALLEGSLVSNQIHPNRCLAKDDLLSQLKAQRHSAGWLPPGTGTHPAWRPQLGGGPGEEEWTQEKGGQPIPDRLAPGTSVFFSSLFSPLAFSVLLIFDFPSFPPLPFLRFPGSAQHSDPGAPGLACSSQRRPDALPIALHPPSLHTHPLCAPRARLAGLGKWELLPRRRGCESAFLLGTRAWAETLGEDVQQALCFPRLELQTSPGAGGGEWWWWGGERASGARSTIAVVFLCSYTSLGLFL